MFVDVTTSERKDFLSQTYGSLIPGYTGHCPSLKFRVGRCYGASTKEIIRDLAVKGVVNAAYREPDLSRRALGLNYPDHHQGGATVESASPAIPIMHRDPAPTVERGRYIHGYTGFVPGLHFAYGRSYCPAAEESYSRFLTRLAQTRLERERVGCSALKAMPRECRTPARSRQHVERALCDYNEKHRYREEHISAECPPIAGYTGHLPRVLDPTEDLVVSRSYHEAARLALLAMRREREARGR